MQLVFKINRFIVFAMLFLLILFSCKNSSNKCSRAESGVLVFVAASLTNVITEIVDSFETKYNLKVKVNLASSGTLARQIVQGGQPDIYLSANKRWANYIDSLGFVYENLKQEIAQNKLVLIVPKNSIVGTCSIDSLFDLKKIIGLNHMSMGDPQHVPAGKYAKQALSYFNIYESVREQILPTKDVRTALMLVEMNEVPLGIVFGTDAKCSTKVKVIATFPEKSHKPIKYMAAACNNNVSTLQFYEYLNSDETKAIWTKFGFLK